MMNGKGWTQYDTDDGFYIGNIPAINRLNISSINMQDAGQGRCRRHMREL